MENRYILSAALIGAVLFGAGCSDEPASNFENQVHEEESASEACIYAESEELVAISNKNRPLGRSTGYTVETCFDDDGMPLMYAFNYYEGGFMVLSGLKTHLPVLAVSETGSFDFNTNLPGIKDWIANAKASIRYSKDNYASNLRELSTLWQAATGKAQSFGNATTITHKSRGNIDCSDEQLRELSQLMQDFRNELQSQGYEVMDIHQTSEYGYTPEMSEVFLRRAKEAIYPLYEEYYEDLCFVVHITGTADGQGPGRLINTSWGQAEGFNRYFPLVGGTLPKAGCGPVALGQIMNYHKFPAEYEWNTMHPIYSTTESARLLYDIACNANYTVENGGAKTSVYTLCRALDKMGYNAKAINHNFEKVMIELTNQRPV